MEIVNLIAEYGSWSWIIGGLVLLALELVLPGGVFVWLGMAGVVTGLIVLGVPSDMPWALQWVIFGALSLAGIVVWMRVRSRFEVASDRPFLNRRGDSVVGEKGFLSEPIVGTAGRMELGDTVWRVTGPELPAGHYVEIVGVRGATLVVKSANDDAPPRTA